MGEEVSKIKEAQKELETTKNLADEYLNGWKRAKADLINYQKEMEKQKEDLSVFVTANLVLAILPIYEGVEKMVESIKNFHPHLTSPSASGGGGMEGEAFIEGVQNIKKQFDDLLKNLGAEKIKTVGGKFNPNFHECVSVKKVEGEEPGEILEEAQAGYMMNGEVIRAAKVVVAE